MSTTTIIPDAAAKLDALCEENGWMQRWHDVLHHRDYDPVYTVKVYSNGRLLANVRGTGQAEAASLALEALDGITATEVLCPSCAAAGPFEHLIETCQAIAVDVTRDEDGHVHYRVQDDAEATEENTSEAGFRCGACGHRFDRF